MRQISDECPSSGSCCGPDCSPHKADTTIFGGTDKDCNALQPVEVGSNQLICCKNLNQGMYKGPDTSQSDWSGESRQLVVRPATRTAVRGGAAISSGALDMCGVARTSRQ